MLRMWPERGRDGDLSNRWATALRKDDGGPWLGISSWLFVVSDRLPGQVMVVPSCARGDLVVVDRAESLLLLPQA